jgi:protein phosphatase
MSFLVQKVQAILPRLVKEAFEIKYEGFNQVVQEATHLLSEEDGKVGNFNIVGRLVEIEPLGEALIIGDLHGDLESLVQILQESNFLEKLERTRDAVTIFLGDYGDRGMLPAEVYYTVLKLKLLFPQQVVLMRGNHEGPEDLTASPHDLPSQFEARFGLKGVEAYSNVRELFEQLYSAVLVKDRYLLVHGGVPAQARSVQDLALAHTLHPKESFLEELLWSDPEETLEEASMSPRGAGRLFGKRVTDRVLRAVDAKILIRGHEPCENGFKINHDGKVLTLFSRKGAPYFNTFGAYFRVKLSQKLEKADQLVPYIHKF